MIFNDPPPHSIAHGVLLAAGDATRLPNKPLLPTRHGIVIESALSLLKRSGCDDITVVIASESLLPAVLEMMGWKKLNFVVQKGRGVMGAVRTGYDPERRNFITFCDNIFTQAETISCAWNEKGNWASVRKSPNTQLDRWSEAREQWVNRTEASEHLLALAGWYSLAPGLKLDEMAYCDSVGFLNALEAKPIRVDYAWHDVGTPESYERYLCGR